MNLNNLGPFETVDVFNKISDRLKTFLYLWISLYSNYIKVVHERRLTCCLIIY